MIRPRVLRALALRMRLLLAVLLCLAAPVSALAADSPAWQMLREGARVVTGVVADAAASASNGSPLLPRFGRNRQVTSQQRQGGTR